MLALTSMSSSIRIIANDYNKTRWLQLNEMMALKIMIIVADVDCVDDGADVNDDNVDDCRHKWFSCFIHFRACQT